jgi:mannose-6-phosphate isomerase-like protein (cupin superfamily)
MSEPVIVLASGSTSEPPTRIAAVGNSFSVHEWRGSGPATLHVHHADDEAWHVLEGILHFRFVDREVDVGAGGSVFVPAGVPHTYTAIDARYLIVLTPRIAALIAELQQTSDRTVHPAIYLKHESTLLE